MAHRMDSSRQLEWSGRRDPAYSSPQRPGIGAGDLGFLAFVSLPTVLFWVAYKHNSFWFALSALTFDLVWLMMQIQSWWPSLHLWNGQELAACLRQRSHNKSSAFIRQPRGSRRHALHDSRATHRCANYRTGEPSPDQTLVAEKPQRLAEKWVLTLAPLMEELPNRIPNRNDKTALVELWRIMFGITEGHQLSVTVDSANTVHSLVIWQGCPKGLCSCV
jgi:hypothetical protein